MSVPDLQQRQPDWVPSEQEIQRTNIAWLMRETGVHAYPQLHAWSAQHRARYWELAAARLGVRFHEPPARILDDSGGTEYARWMVGAALNIADSCFAADADSTAIIYQAEDEPLQRMTVGTLRNLTWRVAHALRDRGIGPGDAVAMALPMTAESVAAYLGVIRAGAAVVGIADSFSSAEISVRLRIAQARLVFTQDVIRRGGKRHELYARVRSAGTCPAIVLPADDRFNVELIAGDCGWEQFLGDEAEFSAVPRSPDDTLNILFSSGTTGEPKAIPWTHLCPIKCAADAHFHHDVQPGEILAWPTSLGWMMGPWLIFASLMNRATMALYYGAPTDRGFGQFVEQAQVNMLGVVPSLVAAWRGNGCLDGLDWSRIRRFSSTGECSRPEDMRWLMQTAGGRPVIEYCGGTEVAGGYISGTLVQSCYASTFSTPTLGLAMLMLDENARPADRGELYLVPPSIGMSTTLLNRDHHAIYYEGCPSGPAGQTLRRHGDELERLPNGYWRALGRVDDTMNLGGIKVSSAEIERVVNRVDGVAETAAVAETPDDGGPSRLVIYAVMGEARATEALRAEMQAAIRRELNPLFKIFRVEQVKTLPRTASNKVMRRMLRRGASSSSSPEK
jgi:acetyl-CoA synthetase